MRALLLAAAVSTLLLAEAPPQLLGVRTTLSAENLRLPGNEALGLMGLSSTADLGPFYLGPGLYGAARGARGGFFTFGLEGGLRGRPILTLPLELDAGCFLGGGGGASAPQGSGLMLRPHVGAALLLGRVRLGAELSRVHFPDGGIDSTQAALTLSFTSERLWVPDGGRGPAFEGSVDWEGQGLEPEARHVEPSARTRLRASAGMIQRSFDLAGLSFTHDLTRTWFRFLSLNGAAQGSSPGYAQVLAGLGLRSSETARFGLEARLGAGLGGGGDVDTGGGFMVSGEGAITLRQAGWQAAVGLGVLRAPGGQFDSRTIAFRLSHRTLAPAPSGVGEALGVFDLAGLRIGSGLLTYLQTLRYGGREGVVRVMTLRADRELGLGLYLSGEAGSATGGGGVGGYSTGLVGLGWETPRWACQRLFAEVALGAGGGGTIRSGGGLLASVRSGWRLELPWGLGLDASAGRARAPHGDLDTPTYGLGLHLRFQALER